MSAISGQDDSTQSKSLDEAESPRKRMRLDNSSRKSWSLMDRRTDQDVLHEMGVSMLESDESEGHADTVSGSNKPTLKRKHDIENVSPNVNLVTSPLNRLSPRSPLRMGSPRSPRCKRSPTAGPSGLRAVFTSAEKCKVLQQSEHQLETTVLAEYIIDEETPLAQSVSAHYMPTGQGFSSTSNSGGKRKGSFTALGLEEELIISRRRRSEQAGADSFSVLSDEMMLSILRWLPKRTLAHCMMVCKRWHRVASDETLWQRLDLGNKVLLEGALGRVLARKPVIVRLASSEVLQWRPTEPVIPSRIQYLDLSMCTIDLDTLNALLERCPLLKKLSLEGVTVGESTCKIIGKCINLETLNLAMAEGSITADGLRTMLEGCVNIQALNISWCRLSDEALDVLVSTLPPRLQRLNLGGARTMKNEMVSKLVSRCPRLLELDLSDCSSLGVPSILAVMTLTRLEHLAVSRCYLLPPHAFTKLGSMASLQYLEVWGMLQTASLSALKVALPAIQINQFMFSAIARPTVGTRRTSIWGLRTRD